MGKKILFTEKQIKKIMGEAIDELDLYHGTRADFNKFDFAYLSTGWGQQAHGYGFYLTDSYNVAKEYAVNGQVMKVQVPDGKYLTDKSISQREKDKIAQTFFKYYTEENEDMRDSYPDAETKQAFWDYEVDYIRRCSTGTYVYGTLASIMGSNEDTSNFLHDKLGYVGLKIHDVYSDENRVTNTYVIFNADDIKILGKNKC